MMCQSAWYSRRGLPEVVVPCESRTLRGRRDSFATWSPACSRAGWDGETHMSRLPGKLAWICGIGLMVLPLGCAAPESNDDAVIELSRADHSLLFNRRMVRPTGEEVAYRSDWPSTASLYSQGEQLYYRESIYDMQGPWPRNDNYTYRRFRLERQGTAAR